MVKRPPLSSRRVMSFPPPLRCHGGLQLNDVLITFPLLYTPLQTWRNLRLNTERCFQQCGSQGTVVRVQVQESTNSPTLAKFLRQRSEPNSVPQAARVVCIGSNKTNILSAPPTTTMASTPVCNSILPQEYYSFLNQTKKVVFLQVALKYCGGNMEIKWQLECLIKLNSPEA